MSAGTFKLKANWVSLDTPPHPTSKVFQLFRMFTLAAMVAVLAIGPLPGDPVAAGSPSLDWVSSECERVLQKAELYLEAEPRTVTADTCKRSAGTAQDFYSEGDYWWPDPTDPAAKYVQRDGETNPNNFVAHRHSMVRLADIVGTLASAYVASGDDRFAAAAATHLKAWFVAPETRMNPSLLYGQAIQGRHTGRSIGVIDTIHLIEVARGAKVLRDSPAFVESYPAVRDWFAHYLDWINTHPYGLTEKVHPNNHGVCWSLQASAFADLVGDEDVLSWVRQQFRTVYLTEMMNAEGGFDAELKRTKPYGYSLFVIDAMAGVAQIASSPQDYLWTFALPDGRGMRLGVEFIKPYVRDKSSWPYDQDVQFWDQWPVRHPTLLFGGIHFDQPETIRLWQSLPADPETPEVLRNLPIRHPLLWVEPRSESGSLR